MDDNTRLREENARLSAIIERCVMDKVRAGVPERAVRLDLGLVQAPPQWAEDSQTAGGAR